MGRIWYLFSTQQIKGHPTIFNLMFSIVIFCLLSIAYLIGGGILLTISLRQVQIKATYSDVGPLAALSDQQRSLVMQGNSAPRNCTQLSSNCRQQYAPQLHTTQANTAVRVQPSKACRPAS